MNPFLLITKGLARFLKKHELRRIRFHDLQHTAASNMYLQSQDPLSLSRILGHSASSLAKYGISEMTQHYIALDWNAKYAVLKPYHELILCPRNSSSPEEK